MRIAVIGDPHFDNRKMFGYPTEQPGVNSRLANIVQVFKWISDDIPEDVHSVVLLGDTTHQHGKLTPPVLHAVYEALGAFGGMDDIFILSGNHDIDHNGRSIIGAFAYTDGIYVANPPELLTWYYKGAKLGFIPYMDHDRTILALSDMLSITGDHNIVFMHHHFEGAKHGAHEFEPPGGLSPNDIPDAIDLVLSGHYHMHHRLGKKIIYVGAPIQHDFGEATYTPGYIILDLDTLEYEFREVPATVAPRFHIITPGDKIPGDPERDYYRLEYTSDIDPKEVEGVDTLKHVVYKVIPVEYSNRSRVSEAIQEEKEKLDVDDIISAYAIMNAPEDKVEDLTKLGMELVLSGS